MASDDLSIGPVAIQMARERVIVELKTTFVGYLANEIPRADARRLNLIDMDGRRATGAQYLINLSKGIVAQRAELDPIHPGEYGPTLTNTKARAS